MFSEVESPCFYTSNLSNADIEHSSPRRLHPEHAKPSAATSTNIKSKRFHTRRHTNPLAPTYKLPSYTPVPVEPPRGAPRDILRVDDIEGTLARPLYRACAVRDPLKTNDIAGTRARPTPRFARDTLNVSDIVSKKWVTSRRTNPVVPVYDLPSAPMKDNIITHRAEGHDGAVNDAAYWSSRKSDMESNKPPPPRSAPRPGFSLRTDDIEGARPSPAKKMLGPPTVDSCPPASHPSSHRKTNPVDPLYTLLDGRRADADDGFMTSLPLAPPPVREAFVPVPPPPARRKPRGTDPCDPNYFMLDGKRLHECVSAAGMTSLNIGSNEVHRSRGKAMPVERGRSTNVVQWTGEAPGSEAARKLRLGDDPTDEWFRAPGEVGGDTSGGEAPKRPRSATPRQPSRCVTYRGTPRGAGMQRVRPSSAPPRPPPATCATPPARSRGRRRPSWVKKTPEQQFVTSSRRIKEAMAVAQRHADIASVRALRL